MLPESRTGPKWFSGGSNGGKTELRIRKITKKLGKWRKRAYLCGKILLINKCYLFTEKQMRAKD
jgi:hypothetical protein